MSSTAGPSARDPALDRPPMAWIIVAHVLGATLIGALDAARVGSRGVALAVVPIFAATGLCAGLVIAFSERLVAGRRWWLAALVIALPTAAITMPVSAKLFEGAYAQTLPLAGQVPYVLPAALWLLAAIAIAIGRRLLRGGDLTARAIVMLGLGGAIGGVVWVERHVLRSGYPSAHVGATLALIVMFGVAIRIVHRRTVPVPIAATVAGVALGAALAAALGGLHLATDRDRLVTFGDQSRDLVRLWRDIFDLDRDGSSALLGGGDCDDFDPDRHPGAIDIPGDGIDQDCDGKDAVRSPDKPLPPKLPERLDAASWRATSLVAAVLDRTRTMDVVLITVDALRFDLLATDAPDRADFPQIAKLLDESVWFTHAIAPASGTDVSLSTLLTGRFDPYQPVSATLPEAMRAVGRRTYAAIPGEVTRFVGEVLIGRGADRFTTVHTDWQVKDVGDHVSAPATSAVGLKAIDEADDRPFFAWLHFFDVHEHHQIDVPRALVAKVHAGGTPVIHRYRALLHAIDHEIGRLRDELATKQLADRTIIVFASDHGEALGEDPRLLDTHGQVTYGPLVRIPLAIYIPGVAPGQRTEQVSLVDIAPTLLDLVGAPTAMTLDGLDLVPIVLAAPAALRPPARAIAIHEELQWSVVEWPYQLIVRPSDNLVELYDLERDPGEHRELAGQLPEVVIRLRARYSEFPVVRVDRSPSGRSFREQQAQPPPSHAQR